MNILYINHYAGSIYHGMEYRPYYLAREWVKLGHKVTIVASSFSHLRNKNISIPKGQAYLIENIDGIEYIWCQTPIYTTNGFKRVINIFAFLRQLNKLSFWLIKQYQPQMVIASSTYPFDTKIAATIAKKALAKFIYEVHDLWPLTLIELGGMSKYHPFIWLMQKAEDFAYKNANKVVSLLPQASSYMQEHGMLADKFIYIPNGISIGDWQEAKDDLPQQHMAQIVALKQQNKFLVGYAGGMGEANALNYLISAAKLLNNSLALVLVGEGPQKAQLMDRLPAEGINNVIFLPAINKSQIPTFLSLMDALYLGWNKLSIYRFGISPNKIFDYMLAAKPIVHSVTAGNDLVFEAKCGISIAAQEIKEIARALNEMANMNKMQLQQWGQNGYNYVINHHDYAKLASQFLSLC